MLVEINSNLPFKEISDLEGKVFKLIKDNALLHHKFCVIDEHTLITGSYNWYSGLIYLDRKLLIFNFLNYEKRKTYIQSRLQGQGSS